MFTKKKKTLFIHVGTDKTGSTALQAFFRSNVSALDSLNTLYIRHGRGDRLNHHVLYHQLLEHDYSGLDAMREELLAHPARSGLVSFEGLYHLDAHQLQEVYARLSCFQVKVIIYLRRQSDMVRSGVAQRIKQGTNHLPLSEYTAEKLAAMGQDYLPVLNRFCKVFGRSKVIVRRYERSSWPEGSIFLDFLKIMGLHMTRAQFDHQYTARLRDANPSLDVDAIYLLDTLDRLGVHTQRRRQVLDILLSNTGDDHSTFVPDDLAQSIDDQFEASNRHIAREWFSDAQLFSEPSRFTFRKAADEKIADYFLLVRLWLPFYEMSVWSGKRRKTGRLVCRGRLAAIDGWKAQGSASLKLALGVGVLACRVRSDPASDLAFEFSGKWASAPGQLEVSVNGEVLYQGESPAFSVLVPGWLGDHSQQVVVFKFNVKGHPNRDDETGPRVFPVLLMDSMAYEKRREGDGKLFDNYPSEGQS